MEKNKIPKKSSSAKTLALFSSGSKKISLKKIKEVDASQVADLAEKALKEHAHRHIGSRLKNLHQIRGSLMIWLSIMVILLGSLLVFRSLGQSSYRERSFTRGGVFSEGVLGEVSSLNPLFASSAPERIFSQIAFLRLFDIDSSGKLNYEAVKSLSTSDNYKNFSIKLREDLLWSDGQRMTADDVIFTTEVLKNKVLFAQRSQAWQGVEISKISDFELAVKTPAGTDFVLHSFNFPILPKHSFNNLSIEKIREADFEKKPITSGEFSYKSTTSTDRKTTIRMEKNAKFYGGEPDLDYFEIVGFSQKDDLKKSLLNGEISGSGDLAEYDFSESEISKISKNQTKINRGIFAFFNTQSENLKDKNLRQALAQGVDMRTVRSKMSSVSELNYPIFEEFFNSENSQKMEFNLAEAEKKLDALGWKKNGKFRGKDGRKLLLNIASTSDRNLQSAAEEIKSQLENLGVEVNLTISDKDDKTGAYVQSVVQARSYDILLFEIDFGADADIYPFWHSSQTSLEGLNFSNFKDGVVDDILVNYRNSSDEAARKVRMTSFVNRWLAEMPALAVARVDSTYFYRSNVSVFSAENRLVNSLGRYLDVKNWKVNKSALYKTQ